MTKLLFLDMDGAGGNSTKNITTFVKNLKKKGLSLDKIQREYEKKYAHGLEAIFPDKAKLVSKIIEETDAKIIWSTSWRTYEPYKSNIQVAQDMMNRRGMPGNNLIGYTPDLGPFVFRCQEITEFLESNYPNAALRRCAILDDMEEAGYDLPEACRFFSNQSGNRPHRVNCQQNNQISQLESQAVIKQFAPLLLITSPLNGGHVCYIKSMSKVQNLLRSSMVTDILKQRERTVL